jgi:hypothetical protein
MGTAEVYVDPQITADPTKVKGSTFSVQVSARDVEDLYTYEVKLNWTGIILNATSVAEGNILKRSGARVNNATDNEPFFTTSERSPTANEGTGWTNPTGAYTADDTSNATSTVNDSTQVYKNYGFSIPSDATVNKVEIGFLGWTLNSTGGIAANDTATVMVSRDGGSIYSTYEYPVALTSVPEERWIAVTGAFASWTYSDFSDANWRVKIKHVVVAPNADTVYCDWLPTRVSYSYPWQNPSGAHTLGDGQRANSSHNDYVHMFRNYGFDIDPGAIFSFGGVDVGFRGYTTGDDKVGVSVSKDGGTTWGSEREVTLTGTETTYWLEFFLVPYAPPGGWDYTSFSDGAWRVKVRHIAVSSEDDVYCDWLPTRLTYYYKTNFLRQIWNEPDPGNQSDYVLFYGSLQAPATVGVHGSGTLATITFEVEVDPPNATDLELYSVELRNSFGDPISPIVKSGLFKSTYLSDIDVDGDVDPDDFYLFSGAYGSSPPSNPDCDLDRDGDVDPDDFYIFSGEYGKP